VTGIVDTERVEILSGLDEGAQVVTTGSVAIRDGERIAVAGAAPPGGPEGAGGRGGRGGRGGAARAGGQPASNQ
jgi:hypothetical protein